MSTEMLAEPVTGGYLLEVGKTDDGRWQFTATGPDGRRIASLRQQEPGYWLLIGAPNVGLRIDTEADALAWLTWIADLYTGSVTA